MICWLELMGYFYFSGESCIVPFILLLTIRFLFFLFSIFYFLFFILHGNLFRLRGYIYHGWRLSFSFFSLALSFPLWFIFLFSWFIHFPRFMVFIVSGLIFLSDYLHRVVLFFIGVKELAIQI